MRIDGGRVKDNGKEGSDSEEGQGDEEQIKPDCGTQSVRTSRETGLRSL